MDTTVVASGHWAQKGCAEVLVSGGCESLFLSIHAFIVNVLVCKNPHGALYRELISFYTVAIISWIFNGGLQQVSENWMKPTRAHVQPFINSVDTLPCPSLPMYSHIFLLISWTSFRKGQIKFITVNGLHRYVPVEEYIFEYSLWNYLPVSQKSN